MSKSLRKSLNLDMTDLAEMLRSKGRGKDTVLAHITPKEAALLKSRGGRGSRNPNTGLPEFDDGDFSPMDYAPSETYTAPADLQPAQAPITDTSGGGGPAPSTSTDQFSQGGDVGPNGGPPSTSTDQFNQNEEAPLPPDAGTIPQDTIGETVPAKYEPPSGNILDSIFGANASSNMSSLMKLLGPAAVAALGAKTGTAAAQQGQAAANQVGALSPAVQARANAATQTMTGQLAPAAIQFGQQYGGQVADVQNQLQGVAGNIAAYGAPLINIGQNQMTQALSGGLTPAGQQAYEAQKAQAEQGVANRGGVGAMQAGRAEMDALANLAQQQFQQGQATYQAGAAYGVQGQSLLAQAAQLGLNSAQVQLAQNNLANTIQQNAINLSLSQAGISDQYLIQSIQMGLASDQQTAANLQGLYSKMAQIAFSQPTTTTTTTRPAA